MFFTLIFPMGGCCWCASTERWNIFVPLKPFVSLPCKTNGGSFMFTVMTMHVRAVVPNIFSFYDLRTTRHDWFHMWMNYHQRVILVFSPLLLVTPGKPSICYQKSEPNYTHNTRYYRNLQTCKIKHILSFTRNKSEI